LLFWIRWYETERGLSRHDPQGIRVPDTGHADAGATPHAGQRQKTDMSSLAMV
jgi:hypothetical protein